MRITVDTAERIATLRKDRGGSSDDIVREALDALYWSRMTEASRRMSPDQREEYEREGSLWDRAATADAARTAESARPG